MIVQSQELKLLHLHEIKQDIIVDRVEDARDAQTDAL